MIVGGETLLITLRTGMLRVFVKEDYSMYNIKTVMSGYYYATL